ncbi:DNA/RNA non-specific endonuclease [Bdellovibrio svalbardensis]|uniref:DNA/RNA non-specific endonuclease n=1 Tax=Bdellovibrio svalbardensis TaxID=2972972 RepID=A0ABT6DIV0_9BACT|nr:DNA/RNA non-specific endonuclease [Bdellovibrio svalbardensis]MDG0816444.1 DNA/RNA non-specific endonuclease [Bdellovibrio svalbardensis]
MKYILLVALSTLIISCQTSPPKQELSLPSDTVGLAPLAKSPPSVLILDHKYFVVTYDRPTRLARHVTYSLTATQLKNSANATRSNKFKADPLLADYKELIVKPSEYLKTGYDQGHLANSKDFGFNQEAQDETFVMSNMAPQKPNLNRDAWLKLEDQVRKWACGEEEVKVITGPILGKNLKTLKSGLPIPNQFFKIVLDETPPKKMLAFIYNQTDKGDVMAEREIKLTELKKEVLPQINDTEKTNFSKYPIVPIKDWKSFDCFTKMKPAKIVKK